MNLRIMTPEELEKAYGTDLREAFPPAELKPLSAMERMREKLAGLQREQRERQADAAWMEHYRIVMGNPVRTYEGERFRLREKTDGAAVDRRLRQETPD